MSSHKKRHAEVDGQGEARSAPTGKEEGVSRRHFLKQGALGAAGVGLWATGCLAPAVPGEQGPGDGGGGDAAPDESTRPAIELTKGPYTQLLAGGGLRFRFETGTADALQVALLLEGAEVARQASAGTVQRVDYTFPADDPSLERKDLPGDFAVHQVVFQDLEPGKRYTWRLERGGGEIEEGALRAPPGPGQPFRLGWLSDTMYPAHQQVVAQLARQKPDIIWHGGDIQYQTNFLDTWEGVFQVMTPLFRMAPMQFCVGNHEYEFQEEYDKFFVRLLGGLQGPDVDPSYHGFTYGGIRFLSINSEREVDKDDTPQMRWLQDELMRVEQDPNLRYAVVGFHRPYYTFGRANPSLSVRGRLHPLFQRYKVPLVMTGHNHCYERFEVDGITYIVDGCGGAFTYDPDRGLPDAQKNRPEEIPLRKIRHRNYGCSTLDFEADGSIRLTHYETEENPQDPPQDKVIDQVVISS